MKSFKGIKIILFSVFCGLHLLTTPLFAASKNNTMKATITSQIFAKARENNNWKLAFLTGKKAQIVFMNISPLTNPKNEIGMETHKFDQVIFVVEGQAKTILIGKNLIVKDGDMIFIPQGTPHNIINISREVPLKIVSVYSDTDIPANSVYKKRSDAPQD